MTFNKLMISNTAFSTYANVQISLIMLLLLLFFSIAVLVIPSVSIIWHMVLCMPSWIRNYASLCFLLIVGFCLCVFTKLYDVFHKNL